MTVTTHKDKEIGVVLREHGVRPTLQRIGVYRYLLEHPCHPSADKIYADVSCRYPTFSRTTVYNSLDSLCSAGLVMPVTISGTEVRYDGNPEPHAHFHCLRCHTVTDIELPNSHFRVPLPESEGRSCRVCRVDVYLTGICADCEEEPAIG